MTRTYCQIIHLVKVLCQGYGKKLIIQNFKKASQFKLGKEAKKILFQRLTSVPNALDRC